LATSFAVPSAGNWTPEQQEVLDHLQACYDAWEKSVAEGNHRIWVEACRPDPELVWWWDGDGVPQDMDAYTRLTKWELETEARVIYSDFRPIEVKIHGDTAIVPYYGYAGWVDKNGRRLVSQEKRLGVYQKKDGKWSFIAEMVVEVKDMPDWIESSIKD
jgi:hypothetical protein